VNRSAHRGGTPAQHGRDSLDQLRRGTYGDPDHTQVTETGVSVSIDAEPGKRPAGSGSYQEIQASPEFQQLKRSLRRFAFPMTAAFLAWYLLYVLMSAYARGFMGQKLLGNINVAYVFGLLQFVSTFVIAWVYARHAEKNLDPLADRLRAEVEESTR
jgi:uncharacterized membrane protein (DUF485 family)